MKVLLLSTYDKRGGAAIAAYRLHQGLLAHGVDSRMLVQSQTTGDRTVDAPSSKLQKGLARLRPFLDRIPYTILRQPRLPYKSLQWLPDQIPSDIASINPDIINLHWVADGFLRIETLAQLNKPIVWTLHDMWAFTGGCHYSGECDRYTQSCGSCPQLNSSSNWDLSRWVWQRKAKAWKNQNITIVAPSHWMADCAKKSSLFKNYRIEVIPNGIDTKVYKPIDKKLARNIIGLPQDKYIILFGAIAATSDPRKGFNLLMPALQKLKYSQKQDLIELVVFGSSQPNNPPDFSFKVHYLGRLYDDISLALLYAAADIFVAPSIQDNLPNTVMEALACGTPCVAFNIGGMSDMIEHKQNGYLAQAFVDEDLAAGIQWILADQERYCKIAQEARNKVAQCFTLEIQAQKYSQLFKSILNNW
ncbi:MAG: glycosyltransferase family 4 protein [Xenococcaceae cyanobacterium MO_207.B15]|nr:glycosyltransferase family 4 protein [Xenococcaceae cyanobacterium MO_207.B15]